MSQSDKNDLLRILFNALKVEQGVDYKGKITNPHEYTQLEDQTFKDVNETIRFLLSDLRKES